MGRHLQSDAQTVVVSHGPCNGPIAAARNETASEPTTYCCALRQPLHLLSQPGDPTILGLASYAGFMLLLYGLMRVASDRKEDRSKVATVMLANRVR